MIGRLVSIGLIDSRNVYFLMKGEIFPLLFMVVGAFDGTVYSPFSFRSDVPICPNTHVTAVEEKLVHHMDEMALGSPLERNKTVESIKTDLLKCQVF